MELGGFKAPFALKGQRHSGKTELCKPLRRFKVYGCEICYESEENRAHLPVGFLWTSLLVPVQIQYLILNWYLGGPTNQDSSAQLKLSIFFVVVPHSNIYYVKCNVKSKSIIVILMVLLFKYHTVCR